VMKTRFPANSASLISQSLSLYDETLRSSCHNLGRPALVIQTQYQAKIPK